MGSWSLPFYEIYKTFVYNGSYSVEAIEKQGPKDHAIPYLSATIYDGLAEKHIGPRSITGEEFAIGYARLAGSGSVTLLQMLSPAGLKGFDISIWKDPTKGSPDIVVKTSPKGVDGETDTLWLDPTRDFSLVKRESIVGSRKLSYEIDQIREIAPRIWMPISATVTKYSAQIPRARIAFAGSNFKANLPLGDDAFALPLKVGCHVEDKRFGTSLIIGRSPGDVLKDINSGK